jgi:signal transduction histidine kinase
MIEEMRKMSQSLSPLGLESFGLAVLVNKFKNSLRGKMAPNLSINISEIEDFIPHEKKINIYRIIQESLTNIIKHAKAKNITISGKRTPKKVTIKVQDDGSGFVNNANPTQEMDKNSFGEPLHSNSGIGLLIMKERAKMMGGELFIFSNRDTGTEVRIEIPSQ